MSFFGPLVTKILHDKSYDTKAYLDQLPHEAYDEMQVQVLKYIDEYRAKHGDMPSPEIFKTDYPQYYTELYISTPITDLRERFTKSAIEYVVNKGINDFETAKIKKSANPTEPIYKLVEQINGINSAGKRTVKEATNISGIFQSFGGDSISLGIPFIDNVSKMYSGNYYALYGQSGGTKSYLMAYIATQLLLAGKKVLIAPCEVGIDGYMARITGILNNFSVRDVLTEIEKDSSSIAKYDALSSATMSYLHDVRHGRLFFTEKGFPTIKDIENDFVSCKPDLVIIDSVYDLARHHSQYSKNRWDAEAAVSSEIKEFTKNGITIDDKLVKPRVFVASQLSKGANSKSGNIGVADIYGSVQSYFDADAFFVIYRSVIDNQICMDALKTRNSENIKGVYEIEWDTMKYNFEAYFTPPTRDAIKTIGKHEKAHIIDYAMKELGIAL